MLAATGNPVVEYFWYGCAIYLWVVLIWLFIKMFTDVFHRDDITGAGKAGWMILLFLIPFIGTLIYLFMHPKRND